jgi:thiosulfate dehydrogenase
MSYPTRRVGTVIVIAIICMVSVMYATQLRAETPAPPASGTADQAAANAAATMPPGPQGELIAYGRDLIEQTPKYMAANITARLSCAACHPGGGTQPHAGSLLGVYAKFPQWNNRAQRFIALQDRIAECFLYSMNGKPPAYYSHEMVAITAYIAWLSRGAPTGTGFANQGPLDVNPPAAANLTNGAAIYASRCASCHGANGNGMALTFPPLWGPESFNDKAGMSRTDRIVPFVKAAMPLSAPGSLSDQEAADVAAFILSKPRPHFDKDKAVDFPSEKAGYF